MTQSLRRMAIALPIVVAILAGAAGPAHAETLAYTDSRQCSAAVLLADASATPAAGCTTPPLGCPSILDSTTDVVSRCVVTVTGNFSATALFGRGTARLTSANPGNLVERSCTFGPLLGSCSTTTQFGAAGNVPLLSILRGTCRFTSGLLINAAQSCVMAIQVYRP